MGALVPIAGGAVPVAGASPALRLIQGGLAAGAAGAGAGAGAAGGSLGVGAVVPLALAFAGGFALGTLLLNLWNSLNQLPPLGEVDLDPNDPATWPEVPPTGNLLFVYQYFGTSWLGPGETNLGTVGAFGGPAYGVASVTDSGIPAYTGGPNENLVTWAFPNGSEPRGTWTGKGGGVRLLEIRPWGGYTGPIPKASVPSGPGISRSPLLELLSAPSATPTPAEQAPAGFVPPAQPIPQQAPSRAPVVVPAPVIAPAPAPRPAVPAGRPAPAPAPGALPQITPGPGQAPARQPQPSTFPQVDPLRPPVPIGPAGVPVAPAPGPVPTTPADIIQYPGLPVGDAGARPRPDLDSIARELGRQEQKLAGLLGGLGYPEAFDRLIDLLTSINPGGSYSIRPACGTDADGNPLPPIEVPIQPTIGDTSAVIARLDAIAELIDHHKQLRQPICKGKPTGESVTVTFVESE